MLFESGLRLIINVYSKLKQSKKVKEKRSINDILRKKEKGMTEDEMVG